MPAIGSRVIHGVPVQGLDVDPQTRCAHYKSDLDIVAIKFKCCGRWFPCFECHGQITDHRPDVWPEKEFQERAILCGACGNKISIRDYMVSRSACTQCASRFNPGCAKHYHLYFEWPQVQKPARK